MLNRLIACLAVVAAGSAALAQPMADRVPADAIVYVGWQGAQAMPPGYQTSRLKGVMDECGLPALFNDFVPRAAAMLAQKKPEAATAIQMAMGIGATLWRHPSALYFAGVDMEHPAGPRPKLGIVCLAGADADALMAQLDPLREMMQQAPVPVRLVRQGEVVALLVGYDRPETALPGGQGAQALATAPTFTRAMRQVPRDPVIVLYADVEAALTLVDGLVKAMAPAADRDQWDQMFKFWGLEGMRSAIVAGGFDGRDWSTRAFVEAPAPRKGQLAAWDMPPLTDEFLSLIPATATWVSATRFDAVRMLDDFRSMPTPPDEGPGVDAMLTRLNEALGFDLRRDLLAALGTEAAFYIDPSTGPSGLLGLTMVMKLQRPADVEKNLVRAQQVANEKLAEAMEREGIRIAVRSHKSGDLTIHTLSVPAVAPSWTISRGNLYVALYPQVVAAAASRQGPSILENPGFVALRKRLGGERANSLAFADLPATASGAYGLLLPLTQLGTGFADMFGLPAPPMMLPRLDKLREQLAPAGGFGWVDDAGWHYSSVSPFPGGELLAMEGTVGIAGAAVAAGALVPALNSARERANRVKCASNLRQIGFGILVYVNEQKVYPPTLGELVRRGDMLPTLFVCPTQGTAIPLAVMEANRDVQARWVDENTDYVYLGTKVKPGDPADRIVAYEKIHNHLMDGVNVLFKDGHIEWLPVDDVLEALERQGAGVAPADGRL